MDSCQDGLSLGTRQVVEQLANALGLEAVEAGSRLVQQDDRGLRDKLNANGAALALAAREDFPPHVADLAVGLQREAELENNSFYELVLLVVW